MRNIPDVKIGIVAVSRDCFPISLSERRRAAVVEAYRKAGGEIVEIHTTVENETDGERALLELRENGCNALVLFLGNFGPEGPETQVIQKFGGPAMVVAAAEESQHSLIDGRGDAYCGMLNASYSLALRHLRPYIPEYPVGTAAEIAAMIAEFVPIARVQLGLRKLKIFTFGPRPYDFLACNAPIKALFDLGVEVQENSELDLYAAYHAHKDDPRIPGVIASMEKELGEGNRMPGILPRLAQYEITLLDWAEQNKGASEYFCFANKCWPSFQTQFGFVPCYVNSRLTARLIPVSCEVDIYGALSEYIIACATEIAPTLLDINNSVPADMYESEISGKYPYTLRDTFMGFHCGNTPLCHLRSGEIKFQRIMKRSLEPDTEPDITRGTLEGDIKPGKITFFRLQSAADTSLHSYIAEGEILPVATRSFGGIGVFAIPEMGRFYRHVLIAKHYPHHGAVAFANVGKVLFAALKCLGVEDVAFNQPKGMLYKDENPFA
ncbi:MAG TPA: fucose isomerase [Candidatus Onthenecus intestinigallinarum]|uniref:Fucose isomerase n=1 Tax=Candidatus Onthenecus intestinigallinarum TaxID=2840875 RepID=A0A9D1CRU9_9FIRM|nr:fucose isomerase [Candidatus Onthenecus intestinigallinarum]